MSYLEFHPDERYSTFHALVTAGYRLYVFPVGTGGDPRRLGELLLLARRLFKSDKSFARKTLLFIENREEIVKQLSWDRDSRKIVDRTIVLFFDLIFDIFSVSTE